VSKVLRVAVKDWRRREKGAPIQGFRVRGYRNPLKKDSKRTKNYKRKYHLKKKEGVEFAKGETKGSKKRPHWGVKNERQAERRGGKKRPSKKAQKKAVLKKGHAVSWEKEEKGGRENLQRFREGPKSCLKTLVEKKN